MLTLSHVLDKNIIQNSVKLSALGKILCKISFIKHSSNNTFE